MGIFGFLSPRIAKEESQKGTLNRIQHQELQERLKTGGILLFLDGLVEVKAHVIVFERAFRMSRLHWLSEFPQDPNFQRQEQFLEKSLTVATLIARAMHIVNVRQIFAHQPAIKSFNCTASLERGDSADESDLMPMYSFTITRKMNEQLTGSPFDNNFWDDTIPDWVESASFREAMWIEKMKAATGA